MEIILTTDALKWLEENNISLHNRFGSRLIVGNKISFIDDLEVEPYVGFHAGNTFCKMGYMSYSNSPVPQNISLERYCSLAWGLTFPSWNHPIHPISTSVFTHDPSTDLVVRALRAADTNKLNNLVPCPQKPPVKIENDVWIGQDSTILPGLVVGNGSIIAANSVVTRDVEPYAIVGGNPAKIIRFRFSVRVIEGLQRTEWWKYNFTDFNHLSISEPEKFIDQFMEIRSSLSPYNPNPIKLIDIPKT